VQSSRLQSPDARIGQATIHQGAVQRSRAISLVRANGDAACAACRPPVTLPLDGPGQRIVVDGNARHFDAAHQDLAARPGTVSALARSPFAGDTLRPDVDAGRSLCVRGPAALLIRSPRHCWKRNKKTDQRNL